MRMKMDRRDFLKSMGAGFSALMLNGKKYSLDSISPAGLGRVTAESVSVYSEPSDRDFRNIRFQHYFNEIIHIYDRVESEDGPGYNPFWFRVWGGYMHSAYIQPVRNRLNPILKEFPSIGQLMEVSVPFTRVLKRNRNGVWEDWENPEKRNLYFASTHIVFETVQGPDGEPWYRIHNALLTIDYYARATHLRKVEDSELAPIHPEIQPNQKRIEVSIDHQKLAAFEGDQTVKESRISTGQFKPLPDPSMVPWQTPKGDHEIFYKRPSVHMGEGTLRVDPDADEYEGVPWVSYVQQQTGVAIHGTFWHNNYGAPMSHGCINMLPEDAKWIYRWTTPYPNDKNPDAYRTPVYIY